MYENSRAAGYPRKEFTHTATVGLSNEMLGSRFHFNKGIYCRYRGEKLSSDSSSFGLWGEYAVMLFYASNTEITYYTPSGSFSASEFYDGVMASFRFGGSHMLQPSRDSDYAVVTSIGGGIYFLKQEDSLTVGDFRLGTGSTSKLFPGLTFDISSRKRLFSNIIMGVGYTHDFIFDAFGTQGFPFGRSLDDFGTLNFGTITLTLGFFERK